MVLGGTIEGRFVITSYSIHYTKLYEARPIFAKAGLEIVYDKSYPLGTQDLSPIVKGAKDTNPDARNNFV